MTRLSRGRRAIALAFLVASVVVPAATVGPVAAQASTWAQAAAPAPIKSATYRGSGDIVLVIQRTRLPGILTLTHDGTSNFIVTPIDLAGKDGLTLVNAIGRYQGTRPFNTDYFSAAGISGLQIQADGPWTLTVRPLASARRWAGRSVSGKGDDVLLLSPPAPVRGLSTLTAAHNGPSNFIVRPITAGRAGISLVNKIGRYRGTVRLPGGTEYLDVTADGDWAFTR